MIPHDLHRRISMSKPTRGAAKAAPGKRKAKVRPQPRPTGEGAPTVASEGAVQAEAKGNVAVREEPVLRFRPGPRETAPIRATGGKAQAARAPLPTVDYSYVYTDLKIIGVLVSALLVALIALSFVIH